MFKLANFLDLDELSKYEAFWLRKVALCISPENSMTKKVKPKPANDLTPFFVVTTL